MPLTHTHAADMVAHLATLDPDATTASTVTTEWVDVGDFHTIMATVMVGTLGASATVDAKLEQATSAAGAGAKDITGAEITQITQAGTDQSDTEAIISLQADALDVDNAFRYVRLSVTVGTATSDVAGYIVGVGSRVGPASDANASTVGEVVRVG